MSTLKTIELGDHDSTIMDMPVEILSKIFISCLDPDWYMDPPIRFNSHQAPLLLTKVCRHWRTVSQSTQHLWTMLPHLGPGVTHIQPGSGAYKLFRMYLAYSGNAPLSILIFIQTEKQNDGVIALLSPHLHHIGRLRISFALWMGAPGHLPDRFFAGRQGDFALLTHLRIASPLSIPQSLCSCAFEGAPLLRSVSLTYFHPQVSLPWSQLKYYHHHVGDIGGISDTLVLCTGLETLDLCAKRLYKTKSYETRAKFVFLPRLRRMRLIDEKGTSDQLLNSLRAPCLEVIQIDHANRTSPIPNALIACIARSHCAELTSLQLLCSRITVDELLQLSGLAPGLRELDIYFTSDAFRALTHSSTRDNIFPRLARLTVRDVMVPDQELIDGCQSRFSPSLGSTDGELLVEPLQYCEVHAWGGPEASLDTARRLQGVAESFQDDGYLESIMRQVGSLLFSIGSLGVPPEILSENIRYLEGCFDTIEKYEVSHALLLERYGLENVMRNGAILSHLQMRASALLRKWRPLIEEYSAKDTKWIIGPGSRGRARWFIAPTPRGVS
ncbi:hypothetical protein BD779DRAFT_1542261 [Infundibulicybe gibba]|nr:hypothetical protein BD779DRAFT_1542261 [Infundibulicybe gibba]